MEIDVRPFASFRDALGRDGVVRELEEGATVGDLLASLEATHPGLEGRLLAPDGSFHPAVTVLLNGRHVSHFEGVETALAPGDRVTLSPPVTGG
ncbi:ubiquitin-like small modifier protein 1 [Halomarina pelagica]|uniref:ubiquitin-like small modifier protein 1 n=1 Tax=Halomarina pelagica TaxID=2961599 RepID=UPI0020C2BA77|nr:ubiquitin-like small modifier protein 1 [Halomarina sp. BND7]